MFEFLKFMPRLWKFDTLDAPKQLKVSVKSSSTTTDILNKSHDVILKLHKNRKQT